MPRRSPLLEHRSSGTSEFKVAVLWFASTVLSVAAVRAWRSPVGGLQDCLLFTFTFLGILVMHELGHSVAARRYGFRLSLPWFLPLPFWVGTLGAVMRFRKLPSDRLGQAVMGVAGPAAGFVGIVLAFMIQSMWSPSPVGEPLGVPFVAGWMGIEHMGTGDAVGFAGCLGCLITALNLVPFGQLDGGHVLAAARPNWSVRVGWMSTVALLAAGWVWPGWAVWAAMIHLVTGSLPLRPRRTSTTSTGVLLSVVVAIALFLACFSWVPIPVSSL